MILKKRFEKQLNGYINLEKILGHYIYTYHIDSKYADIPIRKFDTPLIAHISITNNCNLNCKYCYAATEKNVESISLDNYEKIISKLSKHNIFSVILTGGEPLMHSNINEILEYTIKNKIAVLVLSNLTLMENLDRKILNSPYLAFQVSLNGVWDDDRNKNENLMLTLKNYNKLISNRVSVIITIVIDNQTIDLRQLFSFLENNKVYAVRFGVLIKLGRNKEFKDLKSYIKYVHQVKEQIDIYRKRNKNIRFYIQTDYEEYEDSIIDRRAAICEAGTSEIFINYNGDVYPCPLFKDFKEFYCGNLLKSSLDDIWNSEEMNKVSNIRLQDSGCQNCNNNCGVWCRGMVYSYTNSIYAKSPFCIKNR